MKKNKLIGNEFECGQKWQGCAIGNDGCLYAVPSTLSSAYRHILKVDPSKDSTELVGPELGKGWYGCITGPEGSIYGIPCGQSGNTILKYDAITQEVTMIGVRHRSNYSAAVGTKNGMIYFVSEDGNILRYDPFQQSNSLVSNNGTSSRARVGFYGVMLAGDGYLYLIPFCSNRVMRFNPRDESTTFIGDDFGNGAFKWRGAVLGPDGNIYGIPYCHNKILKIDIATQTTSLVGPDLGQEPFKYNGGVLGRDNCIYTVPYESEFVLKFNPLTGVTSNVGESLGNKYGKYSEGILAANGYIYFTPICANQVLKVKSWDNWLYLKPRLLVEQRRATRKNIQFVNELNIVQHFIIHSNDDIFRMVLEMM